MAQKTTLISSEGEYFHLDVEVFEVCETLKEMLETLGVESDDEVPIVPLRSISSRALRKIIEWIKYYIADGKKNIAEDDDQLTELDVILFRVDNGFFLELLKAVSFLSIPELYHRLVRCIQNKIEGKNSQAISEALTI